MKLPRPFVDALSSHLVDAKSDLATLNYDGLLYSEFSKPNNSVFDGYKCLVDGYLNGVFKKSNLDPHGEKKFGLYMHLHGSPLMIGDSKIKRSKGGEEINLDEQVHIVLTHVEHKKNIIGRSHVLSEYWRRFELAIQEREFVCLFGYSGRDLHVNEVIRNHIGTKPIQVIEWNGDGESDLGRAKFWQDQLGKSVELERMSNILEFNDWGKFA